MNESLHMESARDDLPDAAIELLQLRGLGPKRVQALCRLGVQSLAELRIAAQERRLRCAPGFSAALEENILRAVTAQLESHPRRPDAAAREQPRAWRQSPIDRRVRRCDRQGHAANPASPTSWMCSIWRSAAG
ncbi:helix-hairpin-helix domain-containing protein [Ramlibacter ginsenosidimutans]|nr:helix-hairpin-helix domain-containing protein [Ramlibacter ginsenosidimutans]